MKTNFALDSLMYNNVEMKYLVALGNPEDKYKYTRHNVGWQAMDYCLGEWRLPEVVDSGALSGLTTNGVVQGEEVTVLYPSTYMNNSGSAVAKLLVNKNEVGNLVVIHDDIDLPFGEVKIGKSRGAGGNNGVQSVIDKLGTKDFVRVRIGIAPKSFWTGKIKRPKGGGPLERFVLKPFTSSEEKVLPEIFKKCCAVIESTISNGVEQTMNKFN